MKINNKKVISIVLTAILMLLIFTTYSTTLIPSVSAGTFSSGKFNLSISLDWLATEEEFEDINDTIQEFSQQLYDSTDGIHQLNKVIVYNNQGRWDTADARLFDVDRTSSAQVLGIDQNPLHMFMDTFDSKYVWVHELGHYAYGNYDEYQGPKSDSPQLPGECTDDGSGQASIMDGSSGYVGHDEFCTPCNHDADQDTEHEDERGMSCWEWMAYGNLGLPWAPNGYEDLRAKWPWNCDDPDDANADPGPTTGYDEVTVIFINVSEPNIVLLIDRSGSMSGQKITDAKNSAKVCVDLMQVGDLAGVVSYASSPSVNYQLAEITTEATKTTIKNAINAISASGSTAMGDGLRTSYNQLINRGDVNSPQAIVLLSNGWQNWGTEHPYDVIPDIKAKDIKVYTVGLGAGADETLMRNIAEQTGGKYYFAASSVELQEIYNDISAAITGAQGAGSSEGEVSQGEVIEEEDVIIDSSIKQVTFTLNWGGSDLDLTLRKPDDSIIDPTVASTDPDIDFISEATYELYRINNPETGTWTPIVEGIDVTGTEEYIVRITAISDISLYPIISDNIQYPEPILISAVLQHDWPIIDANVTATIIKDSESFEIKLYDDGDSSHGDESHNDGIYSNLILVTDPLYWDIFSEDGTYIIKIIAESDGTAKTGGGAEYEHFEYGPIEYVTIDEPFLRETIFRLVVTGIPENLPPVADAGPDQTVEQTSHVGANVTLDGTGSSDPEGDPLTYDWTWDGNSATGATPTITFPLGTTTVTLTVSDGELTDSDTVDINIVDTTPPEITLTSDQIVLWPPNHKYHTIEISDFVTSVTDICDADVDIDDIVITSVSSDEPEDAQGLGDGKTVDDIVFVDSQTVNIRAERQGGGNGRVYTIDFEVTDISGNTATSNYQVSVPHDKESTAIDDGAAGGYTVYP